MKILFSQTYFLPYLSGLTIYAKRITDGLAKKGHQVTILTSQYNKQLKTIESSGKVNVLRVPYLVKLHKSLIMPNWLITSFSKVKNSDVVICNLPQAEGFWLIFWAKILKRKAVVIYTCEVNLPPGIFNKLIEKALYFFNFLSCFFADKIIVYTKDYAEKTKMLQHFKSKQEYVLPPVILGKENIFFTRKLSEMICKKPKEIIIGFAARISAEKGLEFLLKAIPFIEKNGFRVKIIAAGPQKEVVGEKKYFEKIVNLAKEFSGKVIFLGAIPPEQMVSFYKLIDVLVLPSVNSTEAFGIVQVEAMLAGVPVVASDLPGVRVPVRLTGLGETAKIGDSADLAKKIEKVLRTKYDKKMFKKAREIFNINKLVDEYIECLR